MKRIIIRSFTQIIVFAALITATGFALRPLQQFIHDRMLSLKHQVIVDIEKSVGRSISYASISPSIFRYVEVRDLAIYGRSGERTVLLRINRLKIYYDIFAVISGDMANALNSISVENSRLAINTATDQDVVQFLQSVISPVQPDRTIPLPRMTIQGKNLTLDLTGPEGTVHAKDVFFTLRPGDRRVDIRFRSFLTLTLAHATGTITNITAPVTIAATLRAASGVRRPMDGARRPMDGERTPLPAIDADGSLIFDYLTTNSFHASRQAFRLSYADGVLSARKIEDRAPIDVSATVDFKKNNLTASIQSEDFVPGRYFTVKSALRTLEPWISTSFTGKGTINAALNGPRLTYSADFTAAPHNPAFPELRTIRANIHGNEGQLVADNFLLDTSVGTAIFRGNVQLRSLLPEGQLTLRDVATGTMTPLNANLRLVRTKGRVDISEPALEYGNETLHGLNISLTPSPGGINIAAGFSFDLEGKSTVSASGLLPLRGPAGATTDFSASVHNVSVRSLYTVVHGVAPGLAAMGLPLRGLPAPDVVPDGLSLDTSFSVAETAGHLTVDAPIFHLFNGRQREDGVTMSIQSNGKQLSVNNLNASYGDYSASGRLTADFLAGGNLDFQGSVRLQNIPYSFTGTYVSGKELTVRESRGLVASVYFSNLSQVAFQVKGTNIPFVAAKRESALTIDASGIYSGAATWEVNLNKLTVTNFPFVPLPDTSVSISGRLTPGRGILDRVEYSDGASSLTGNGTLTYNFASGSTPQLQRLNAAAFLQLANQQPGESYRLDLSLTGGTLGGDVLVRNMPWSRAGILAVSGGVDAQVRISGPLAKPAIAAQLTLDNSVYGGQPVSGVATLQWSDEVLALDSANINFQPNTTIQTTGKANFRTGQAEATVSVSSKTRRSAPLNVNMKFSAKYPVPKNALDLAKIVGGNIDATMSLSGIPMQKDLGGTWNFTLQKRGKDIRVSGGPDNSLDGRIRENGDFVLSAQNPLPFTFQADGRIKGQKIEANINNVHFNLSLIHKVLDFGVFALERGDVTGGLRINGSTSDPDFYGTLGVTDTVGRLTFAPEQLGPSKTFLVFEEKHVVMTRFTVPLGKSNGQVQGTFTMNRWIPESLTLQVDVPTSAGLKVDYTFGNVTVNGHANGRINIVGTPQVTRVSGNLTAYSTAITLADVGNQQATAQPPNGPPLKLDLSIQSGKRVEFLWPSSTIPVLRGYARLGQTIHIALSTDTGDFSLRGDVGIQSGEIFYFERSFYIKSGMIRFNESQDYFDPRLTVNAEIREVSNTGPVTISLVANDERLSQFTPRFVSNPSMTDSQIVALLGGNFFGELANNNLSLSSAALLAGDLVSQFSVVRSFENAVRDALSLDLFSVRTQLVSNILRGTLPDTQYPLDNTSPSLGKYLDNTTVFLGKYLGTDLFLELLIQLQAQNPFVNTEQVRSFGGLVISPEINLDWRTPFFDLQWNFAPKSPQTLFLSDNTISLSWGFSY